MNRTELNRDKGVLFNSVFRFKTVQTDSHFQKPNIYQFNTVLAKTKSNRTMPTSSPKVIYGKAWCSLFFAIVWIVWEIRNGQVFRGKEADFALAVDTMKFRFFFFETADLLITGHKRPTKENKKARETAQANATENRAGEQTR